ncbi:hypothetical protein HaLaN_03370, partial [Haematococcus lacustris]
MLLPLPPLEAEVSSGSSSLFPTWLHRTTNQLCAALGSASLTLGDPNLAQGHALQQQQADMEQGAWQAHTPHSWQHTLPSSPRSFTGLGRSNSSSLSQGEASWAQGQAGLLSRWQGVAPPGGPQP